MEFCLWTSKSTVNCNCVENCVSVHVNLTLRVSDYSTLVVMVQGGKFLCMCICIHVNVCHVYIVCHVYNYTCVNLVRVDLDIILLVVSDGENSAQGWKPLKGSHSLWMGPAPTWTIATDESLNQLAKHRRK